MHLKAMHHHKESDRGVTLPEVLVAVTILAIIIVPLGDALIGFIRNTDATTRRMNESHDIELATAYFSRDVQNLGIRNWAVAATLPLDRSVDNTSYLCPGSGTRVVSLAGDDPVTATGYPRVVGVTYLVRVVGGERQFRRVQCWRATGASGATGPITAESDVVVVHNLVGTPAPPVCANAAGTSIPCGGAGSAVPYRVTLTVDVKHPANSTPTRFTLTGVRRRS